MPAQVLQAVGLTQVEEEVYQALLSERTASVRQLAASLGIQPARTAEVLAALERTGLVSRTPGRPARYVAAAPELAFESLLAQREAELRSARVQIARLSEQFHNTLKETTDIFRVIEVVTDRNNVARTLLALEHQARHEVLGMDAPPFAMEAGEGDEAEAAALARGVRFRIIYDPASLNRPGILALVAACVAAGEEARVGPVPIKLTIVDGEIALISLDLGQGVTEGALLVRRSSLVEALRVLFEQCWQNAAGLAIGADGSASPDSNPRRDTKGTLADRDRQILTLLAAGQKDEVIAAQLGMGVSTIARRVANLMDRLGARSRFQAGFEAARRHWLE